MFFFLVNQIYSYNANGVLQPIPEQLTQISCFFVVNQNHAVSKYSQILELITAISCFFLMNHIYLLSMTGAAQTIPEWMTLKMWFYLVNQKHSMTSLVWFPHHKMYCSESN